MTQNQFHCTLEDQAIDIADGIEAQSASVESTVLFAASNLFVRTVYVVHQYDEYSYEVERLPGGIDRGEYRRVWGFEYRSDVVRLLGEECYPHTPSL